MLHRAVKTLTFLALSLTTAAPICVAQDSIFWGEPQRDIRIGLAAATTPAGPVVTVLIENTAPREQTVLIGRITGARPNFISTFTHLHFAAVTPDGHEIKLTEDGPPGVAGYMGPLTLRLTSAATAAVDIPMSKLFMIDGKGKRVPLDAILHLNYSVSVSLEVAQNAIDSAPRSNPELYGQNLWTGIATSGRLHNPA